MDKVFRASLGLLDTVARSYHGTPSVPFATSIPNGPSRRAPLSSPTVYSPQYKSPTE